MRVGERERESAREKERVGERERGARLRGERRAAHCAGGRRDLTVGSGLHDELARDSVDV